MASAGTIKVDIQVGNYWQTCPVCNGRGFVPAGFYNTSPLIPSTNTADERCRRCHGDGTVTTPPIHKLGQTPSDESERGS